MPIDRAITLKNAEKLLRQGKLNPAIAEYLRIVEEQPRDFNTANILGDLYVRAKQIDKAVDQFTRIADGLSAEGFLPKAGAVYKKILKLKPDHEHSLLQGAEIAATQGLLADARSSLNGVAARRRTRGDHRGVAQITIRLASLDPDDVAARIAGARARVELKDPEGALRDFKELATELSEKGRQAEVLQILDEASALKPDDPETRERLLNVHLEAGDYTRAREYATTLEQFKDMAARLEAAGRADEALAMLAEAARVDPSDVALRAHLVRTYAAKGDLAPAAEYLTVETAGDDPQLILMVAEAQIRAGRTDEGMVLIRRVLGDGSDHRQDVAKVGWSVAEHLPDTGFQLVEMAADASVAELDWPPAAAALQEFVTRVPNHIPALMRLVEICVDGDLEATMYAAQAQLTDAYITVGLAAEAKFIAEDLVAREPWDRANIERFRRALALSGELDPDAIIAERLSGESPFTSTDLTFSEQLPDLTPVAEARAPIEPLLEAPVDPQSPASTTMPAPEEAGRKRSKAKSRSRAKIEGDHVIDLDANAADLEDVMEKSTDAEGPPEGVEVDLSIVLDALEPTVGGKTPSTEDAPSPTLDNVFARLRNNMSHRASGDESAEEQYRSGVALHEAGQDDEAISALEAASRAPRLRFATASLVGRIQRERGMTAKAVEWFERAAEAPPPTAEDGRLLLYDLADALESVGEVARALAICTELHAEAGNYRDVSARVDRLAKTQARG